MGGKAFDGTILVTRDDTLEIIDNIANIIIKPLGLNYCEVGSNGKRGPSGDVDIVIESSSYIDTMTLIRDRLIELKVNYRIFGEALISVSIPFYGKHVQVDFLMSESLKFSRWMLYSPSTIDSAWKGKYRNEVLSAICDATTIDLGDGTFEKLMLNYNRGLFKVIFDDFTKSGDLRSAPKILDRKFITNDPEVITTMLLGSAFNSEDIMTFEDIWAVLSNDEFKYSEIAPNIIETFALNSTAGYGKRKIVKKIGHLVTDES